MGNDDFLSRYSSFEEYQDEEDFELIKPDDGFFTTTTTPTTTLDNSKSAELDLPPDSFETEPSNVIEAILKSKGISDPTQLNFENEEGVIEKINFYDLPVEEQLSILNEEVENTSDYDLDNNETDLINHLRKNQLTPEEWINHVKQEAIKEYLGVQVPTEEISQMSNEEVFLTDLLARFQDISDEEAQHALNLEMQNESLFLKKVEAIRAELIEKEYELNQQQELEAQEEKKVSFEKFKQSLYDVAPEVRDLGGKIELEDQDLHEAIDFLLAEDTTGTRYIAKALNDPASLLKMAWFYLKGETAFSDMAQYYEDQIRTYSTNNYNKGYEDGKKGITPNKRVVIQNNRDNKQTTRPQYLSSLTNPALVKSNNYQN